MNKSRRASSLAKILFLSFFLFTVVELIFSSGILLLFNLGAQQSAISKNQLLIAQGAAKSVSNYVKEKISILETAIWLNNPAVIGISKQKELLQNLLGLEPSFKQLELFNTENERVAFVSRRSFVEASKSLVKYKTGAARQAHINSSYISPVYIDPVTNEPIIIMAIPIKNVFGVFLGSLIAEVNLKFMWDLVDDLKISGTGYAFVVDRKGNLISFGDASRVLKRENVKNNKCVSAFINNKTKMSPSIVSFYKGINRIEVAGSYVPLGTPDWAVITEMPILEAYRDTIEQFLITVAVLFLMAFAASYFGVKLSRRLSVPIVNLMEISSRIASGERELQANAAGPREVAALATAFNSMTAQLRNSMEDLERQINEVKRAEKEIEKSEKKFRAMIEHSSDAIALIDASGKVMYESPNVAGLTGFQIKSRIGKSGLDNLHPDDLELIRKTLARVASISNSTETNEFRVMKPDGTFWWAEATASNKLHEPDIQSIIVNYRDISKRKEIEQAILKKATENEWLMKSMANAFVIWESVFNEVNRLIDIKFVYINYAYERMAGFKLEEVKGKSVKEVWSETEESWFEIYNDVALLGISKSFEMYLKPTQGTYACTAYRPWETTDRFCVVFDDITERRKTEEIIKQKSEELDRYFSQALDLLCIADTEGNFRRLNKAWESTLGYSLDELHGRKFLEFVHPDDIDSTVNAVKKLSEHEEISNFINRYRCKDGTYRWIEWRSFPAENLIYAVARDITEKIIAEQALKESEEKFRLLIQNSNDIFTFVDQNGIQKYISPSITRVTGYLPEELVEKHFVKIVHPDDQHNAAELFQKCLENSRVPLSLEYRHLCKDGSYKYMESIGQNMLDDPLMKGIIINTRDITERKKSEEELLLQTTNLKRFEKIVVGRELKMIELKQKVTELELKLKELEKNGN